MSKKLVLLFTGNHCAGCKPMKEKLNRIKEEFNEIDFKFYNVDDDDILELLMLYNVRSIPCLVLRRDDAVIDIIIGDTAEDKIRNALEEL